MEKEFDKLRSFFGCAQDSGTGANQDANQDVVLCPMAIGVTGHRKIDVKFKKALKSKIRAFFEETVRVWTRKTMAARFQKSGMEADVPILVLTGMAEGADQWVAETVLEMKSENPNSPLRLISVLPMPLADYVNDFPERRKDGSAPREVFQQLLGESDYVMTLDFTKNSELLIREVKALEEKLETPLSEPEQRETADEIKRKTQEYRRNQYRALGEYLVSHGYIILALWDGINEITYDSDPQTIQYGGTEDVVRMKMEGTPVYSVFTGDPFADVSIQPFGSVYQIVMPRATPIEISENHRSFHAPNAVFSGVGENNVLKTFMIEPKSCEKKDFQTQSWVDNVAMCQTTPTWFYAKSCVVQGWRSFCQTDLMTGKTLSNFWADIRRKTRKNQESFQKFYPTTNTGVSLEIMKHLNRDILLFRSKIQGQFRKTEKDLFPMETREEPERAEKKGISGTFQKCVACVSHALRRRSEVPIEPEVTEEISNASENPDVAEIRKTENYPFLFRAYATFDQLAAEFQHRFQRIAYSFMLLMFFGAFMASMKVTFMFYATYVFLLVLCGVERCFLQYYAKYRRYRTVAEVLRIQIFWDQAKIGISVIDNYSNHQIPELNWFRMALKSFMIPLEKQESFNEKFVQKYWMKGQYEYFRKKLGKKRRADAWCRGLSVLFILLGAIWYGQAGLQKQYVKQVFITPNVATEEGLAGENPVDATETVQVLERHGISFILLSFCLPLGTIIIFYGRVKGFRHEANNYAKILPIYHQTLSAMRKMSHVPGYPDEVQLQKMFLNLGIQALNENVDWHLLPNELKFTK